MKLFAFSIDLEPDYASIINRYDIFRDTARIEELLSALTSMNIKITIFVLGEILEMFPDAIRVFEKYGCEFGLHGYSHKLDTPIESEIKKGKAAFFEYFGKYPTGYRALRGKMTDKGIDILEKEGFLYDATIYPSFFPDPARGLFQDKNIHYYGNSNIMEIPCASVTPFRITFSISFMKLIGLGFYLKRAMPDIISFETHMHDYIIDEDSFGKLSPLWRRIYGRNKYKGLEFTVQLVKHLRREGYRFCYMSEIYEMHKREGLS